MSDIYYQHIRLVGKKIWKSFQNNFEALCKSKFPFRECADVDTHEQLMHLRKGNLK